jgi:hypothetical protein
LLSAFSFKLYTLRYALCAMLHAVFSFEFRIPHSAFGTANFFMDDICE